MRLKPDLRPPTRESIVEATVEDDDSVAADDAVERATWTPVTPEAPTAALPPLAFVDGVQQTHLRVFAELPGATWPKRGAVSSYAAGAVIPGAAEPFPIARVERRVIVAAGEELPPAVTIASSNGSFTFAPAAAPGDDPAAPDLKLGHLRGELELLVVLELLHSFDGLIVADGRLPPVTEANVLGFIKTPHRVELAQQHQLEVLASLRAGQRTPLYRVTRSARAYYRAYICLRTAGPHEIAQSGLGIIEMDDATPIAEARRIADIAAIELTRYASPLKRDARAPQNLLPVAALEQRLRRRLGDLDYLRRKLAAALKEMAA